MQVKCPTCGKPVPWTPEQQWRPFCSERCKLIDLGEWFAETRTIPSEEPASSESESDKPNLRDDH